MEFDLVVMGEFENDKRNVEGRTLAELRRKGQMGQFNCGGYALETFNWFVPNTSIDQLKDMFEGHWLFGTEHSVNWKLRVCVYNMLRYFKGEMRVIKSVKDLKEDEYAIAFKMGETDLHFAKRGRNGQWYHKRGGSWTIERMTKKQVFSDKWYFGKYSSKTVLFAKKRK